MLGWPKVAAKYFRTKVTFGLAKSGRKIFDDKMPEVGWP
jgi:hypothetical protein